MPQIDDHGRPEPDPAVDETATIRGFLDYQRATLDWKTRGLDADGLQTKIAASSMTLGGILKHMAWVEDHWFSRFLDDREASSPWVDIDWKAHPDWEWDSAADDSPEYLRELWSSFVARSRERFDEALVDGDLSQLARRKWPGGEAPSLRWIMVHMIEEYARHNGHADLLREAVDGETGE